MDQIGKLTFGNAERFKEEWQTRLEKNAKQLKNMNIPIGKPLDNLHRLPIEERPEEEYKFETKDNNSAVLKNEKTITNKEQVKKAEHDAQVGFFKDMYSGRNIKREDVPEMAERHVENNQHKEEFLGTRTFDNKAEFKKAEEERKTARKELIKEYRNQGLSRKEAKHKADNNLVTNKYASSGARDFINAHRDDLYENGKLSNDKLKQFTLNLANINTSEDETTNYHLSLKERRAAAEKLGVKASVVKDLCKSTGMDYEKDNTNLYRGLAIGGATAIGAGVGAAFSVTSTSAAAAGSAAAGSGAGAAGAGAGAAAAAVNLWGVGAGVGAAVGAGGSHFLKDKGRKDIDVYGFNETQPQHQPKPPVQPDEPVQPVKPQTPQQPVQPIEDNCPVEKWQEEYCDYTPKNKNEYWYNIVQAKYTHQDGTKITDNKEIKAIVHDLKLRHGIKDFGKNTQPKTMRLFSEVNNQTYVVNCDGKIIGKNGKAVNNRPYTKFNGTIDNPYEYKQDCNDNEPVRIK